MTKEEILEKVRKVLALTSSPNEKEAALAAIKARELMDKYNVQMKDISQEVSEKIEDVDLELGGEVKVYWVCILTNVVGKYQNCRVYRNSGKFCIVGFTGDIELFEYTYIYLRRVIEKLLEEVVVPPECRVKKYLEDYAYGIVSNLSTRFEKEKKKTMSGGDDRALVVIDREKAVDKFCDEYLDLSNTRLHRTFNADAYSKGYVTGDKIVLRNGVQGERKSSVKKIQ